MFGFVVCMMVLVILYDECVLVIWVCELLVVGDFVVVVFLFGWLFVIEGKVEYGN